MKLLTHISLSLFMVALASCGGNDNEFDPQDAELGDYSSLEVDGAFFGYEQDEISASSSNDLTMIYCGINAFSSQSDPEQLTFSIFDRQDIEPGSYDVADPATDIAIEWTFDENTFSSSEDYDLQKGEIVVISNDGENIEISFNGWAYNSASGAEYDSVEITNGYLNTSPFQF